MNWKVKLNGTFFISLVFLVAALFFLIFFNDSGKIYSTAFSREGGKISLFSGYLDDNISLKGEWKFYKDVLLHEGDSLPDSFELVQVPHFWDKNGFGTYVLELKGLNPGICYSLYVPDVNSAYRLFLGSRPLAANGTVGTNREGEILYWQPGTVTFTSEEKNISLYMQISNFHSYGGGFIREMKLGNPETIQKAYTRELVTQMILLGSVLFIILYNLSLFILNPGEKSAGYYALFNIFVAIRIVLTGQKIVNLWISYPDWFLLHKMQYISSAAMFYFLILFLNNLYGEIFHKRIIQIFLASAAAVFVCALIIPPWKLEFLDYFFLGASLLYFFYLIIRLILGIREKVRGSIFTFVGIMFLLTSLLLDMTLPPGSNMIPIGMFIFSIFQSLVIAENYSLVLEQNKKLHHEVTRDGMTNLYKKEHFRKLVSEIIEEEKPLMQHSLMFIDLDNFKAVNDSFGHDAGDEVIIVSAERILNSLRYSDIASRFGGDEFVVWLHNLRADNVEEIAQRIIENLTRPYSYRNQSISISASIGVSFYPDDGRNFEELSDICDKRMYDAKKNGKNQYCIKS